MGSRGYLRSLKSLKRYELERFNDVIDLQKSAFLKNRVICLTDVTNQSHDNPTIKEYI